MMREFRFMLRDRAAMVWIAIAFALSLTAVVMGLNEVRAQHAELAELSRLDTADRELVLSEQSDWGSAGYYTFHLVSDPPSDLAFAALGQRDVSPWKHRIRMLALEGQIYDTDTANPDFALIGRFDFAFIATLLAPLLVILLLFDLKSGERTAGRFELIEATNQNGWGRNVWRSRALLRVGSLTVALLVPLFIGGILSGASILSLVIVGLAVVIYLLFWTWLTLRVSKTERDGSTNLVWGLGLWLFLCAIMPATLTSAINAAVPLPDSGDIVLTQREAVNDAWDLPKDVSMDAFYARHPEWEGVMEIGENFTWTWYYAFQQVGDQTVEPLSLAYREGRARRDSLAGWSSLISPATALQRVLERAAETDTQAASAYEQNVRRYHAELRAFYYPRLFQATAFDNKRAAESLPAYMSN